MKWFCRYVDPSDQSEWAKRTRIENRKTHAAYLKDLRDNRPEELQFQLDQRKRGMDSTLDLPEVYLPPTLKQ